MAATAAQLCAPAFAGALRPGSRGLGQSSAAARAAAAGEKRAGRREEASFLGEAVTSQPSLESISTAASESLLRLHSLDDGEALDEGSRRTPSTNTTPAADDPQDRWLEGNLVVFRHPPTARPGPHRDALRRVQRVHDFKALYDLDAIGDLDESARPAFELGELRRTPRSLDFRELEGVAQFQSEMQAQDFEAPCI